MLTFIIPKMKHSVPSIDFFSQNEQTAVDCNTGTDYDNFISRGKSKTFLFYKRSWTQVDRMNFLTVVNVYSITETTDDPFS